MKTNLWFLSYFVIAFSVTACAKGEEDNYEFPSGDMEAGTGGVDEDVLQDGYPGSVSLYAFTDYFDSDSKCSGWYAIADVSGKDAVKFNVLHYSSPKTPVGIFSDLKTEGRTPYIVTNGGYFYDGKSLSLCIHAGELKSIATQFAYPEDGIAYPVRAAFGRHTDGSFEATWVYCPNDGGQKPYSYPSPLENDESTGTYMSQMPTSKEYGAKLWTPSEAIGGGPMIVLDGRNVADKYYWKEILDAGGTSGMSRQPRTAVAATADGKVILLVCDGRGMNGSMGYTLSELADKLISLGAEMAINLDGGGSSAIVGKDGRVLNRPSDSGDSPVVSMRQVPTALAITTK